jgi:hypothetical protein
MRRRKETVGGTGEGSGARMRTFQPRLDDGYPPLDQILQGRFRLPALPRRDLN